jgi:hypothetical protein
VCPRTAKKDKNGSDQFQEVFAFGDFRAQFTKNVFRAKMVLPELSDGDLSVMKKLLKWYEELDIDSFNKKMTTVRALLEHSYSKRSILAPRQFIHCIFYNALDFLTHGIFLTENKLPGADFLSSNIAHIDNIAISLRMTSDDLFTLCVYQLCLCQKYLR